MIACRYRDKILNLEERNAKIDHTSRQTDDSFVNPFKRMAPKVATVEHGMRALMRSIQQDLRAEDVCPLTNTKLVKALLVCDAKVQLKDGMIQ